MQHQQYNNPNEQSDQLSEEQIEQMLIKEFEDMFSRPKLEVNSYFIFRMNNKLEIPLIHIFGERKIKNITTNQQTVLNALKKTQNINVYEEKELIVPKINEIRNKIIIRNIKKQDELELQEFLKNNPLKDKTVQINYDQHNCFRLHFQQETDAQEFIEWVNSNTYNNQKLEAYFEPENIYLSFLSNVQKNSTNKPQFTTHYGQNSYPPNNMQQNQQQYPYMQNDMNYMFQFMPMFYPFMNPYAFQNNSSYNYHSNLFIRKAKDENQTEQNQYNNQMNQYMFQGPYQPPYNQQPYYPQQDQYYGQYQYQQQQQGPYQQQPYQNQNQQPVNQNQNQTQAQQPPNQQSQDFQQQSYQQNNQRNNNPQIPIQQNQQQHFDQPVHDNSNYQHNQGGNQRFYDRKQGRQDSGDQRRHKDNGSKSNSYKKRGYQYQRKGDYQKEQQENKALRKDSQNFPPLQSSENNYKEVVYVKKIQEQIKVKYEKAQIEEIFTSIKDRLQMDPQLQALLQSDIQQVIEKNKNLVNEGAAKSRSRYGSAHLTSQNTPKQQAVNSRKQSGYAGKDRKRSEEKNIQRSKKE